MNKNDDKLSDAKAKQGAQAEKVETKPETVEEAPKPRTKAVVAHDDPLYWAFEQGRVAAQGSISKEDAPHDPSTDEYKAWLKGWNFAHG